MIVQKSRMPQIQGVQGWSRSKLLRTLGNVDAVGVKPKAMGYHRLSRRVNKMKKYIRQLSFCYHWFTAGCLNGLDASWYLRVKIHSSFCLCTIKVLYFRDNNRFGFADSFTGLAPQTILRPGWVRLVGHVENFSRTINDAVFTSVAPVGINIYQINFVISHYFWHYYKSNK